MKKHYMRKIKDIIVQVIVFIAFWIEAVFKK